MRSKSSQKISLVSAEGKTVKTHTGIKLEPDAAAESIQQCDILFIPALWRNPRPVLRENAALIPWIQHLYQQSTIVAGVGTGCWLMADAGLLENKPATTHWHYFDEFRQQYPNVQLKRAHFITQADRVYCTGSVNAFAELTVHFIEMFYNLEIARHVERHFFHEIRGTYEGDRTFSDVRNRHPDEDVIQAQLWLQNNYSEQIKISELSEQMQMSQRTLNRRFKNATGQTPLEYLHKVRMDVARDLLKNTNLSIGEIIYRVGYHDTTHFAALFKKTYGTTPRQYRVTVRGKLFTLE